MAWRDEMALKAVSPYTYVGHVGDHWASLQGAHGGVVAALVVQAVNRELRDVIGQKNLSLRAATFGYISGNSLGNVDIQVNVLREGRTMVASHATVTQNGKVTTVARFHHAANLEGVVFSDAPAPPAKPTDLVRLDTNARVSHLNNVETHLDPRWTPMGNADRGEWRAWSRPHGENDFDVSWLTMFGDYFPPAVFSRSTAPSRAVTIEYSIQIHQAAPLWKIAPDEYLTAQMHVFHSHDGFAVEDGWIWLPGGELLATTRQTRLAG